MSTAELNSTARELIEVRGMIAELEAEEAALQDKIKAAMADAGAETILGDGWKASWKVITSRRFDSKAFQAAEPALYDAYTRETRSSRFTITV